MSACVHRLLCFVCQLTTNRQVRARNTWVRQANCGRQRPVRSEALPWEASCGQAGRHWVVLLLTPLNSKQAVLYLADTIVDVQTPIVDVHNTGYCPS